MVMLRSKLCRINSWILLDLHACIGEAKGSLLMASAQRGGTSPWSTPETFLLPLAKWQSNPKLSVHLTCPPPAVFDSD